MATYINQTFRCWSCQSFNHDDPTTVKTGKCHNAPPTVIEIAGAAQNLWPTITAGDEEWCDHYERKKGTVPPIP